MWNELNNPAIRRGRPSQAPSVRCLSRCRTLNLPRRSLKESGRIFVGGHRRGLLAGPEPGTLALPWLAGTGLRTRPRATVMLSVMSAGVAHEARRSCGQRAAATEVPPPAADTGMPLKSEDNIRAVLASSG